MRAFTRVGAPPLTPNRTRHALVAATLLALAAIAASCAGGSPLDGQPCYTARPDTENVGPCHAGTRVCEGWDCTCKGEVTPTRERCGVKEDTNCDGFFCGDTMGSLNAGAPVDAVALDSKQNIWTGGTFLLGWPPLRDFEQHPQLLGGFGNDYAVIQGLAIGANDDPIFTGAASGPYGFNGPAVEGFVFVGRLDSKGKGNFVWGLTCGGAAPSGSGKAGGIGVAVDRAGDVVLVGTFAETVDCGDGPHTSAGGADILLVKLSGSDGQVRWSQSFGDGEDQSVTGVALDESGNIFITGAEKGQTSFGGEMLSGGAFYVARFTPDGAHTWSRHFGAANAATPNAITLSAAGPLIVGDYQTANLDFGGGALPQPPPPGTGAFVLQLDGDGGPVWSRGFVTHTSAGVHVSGVTTAADESVLFVGSLGSEIDFGTGPINLGGLAQAGFVAGLDAHGASVWSRAIGTGAAPAFTALESIASGPAGEMVIVGNYDGAIALDNGASLPVDPAPGPRGFIVELAPP